METALKLAGKTALVTGAARGIGRVYALRLASLGADVAILDANLRSFEDFELEREAMTAESVMAEVEQLGRRSIGVQADITDSSAVAAAVAEVIGQWGQLDVLVCNAGGGAGVYAETTPSQLDDTTWDTVIQRNLNGTMYTCRAALAPMKEQGSGRIITISSLLGSRPEPGGAYAHYGAAKAGIIMYTQYLAREVGPWGITANCITPGYIRTGRLAPIHDTMGDLLDTVALRRWGTPEDCAGAVEFLATDLGAYVTGAVIPVDGATL